MVPESVVEEHRVLWNDGEARCGEHLHARQVISGNERTCGMMARRERSSCSDKPRTSTPSMRNAPTPIPSSPPAGSTSRHRAETKVDLPEPVRPTTPTLALGAIEQLT